MRYLCVLIILFSTHFRLENKEVTEIIEEKEIKTFPYSFSNDEILIAKVIHHETCHTEPYEGKVAIGNLIRNRVGRKGFGKTIKKVIFQKGQFACITKKINPCDECKRAAANSENLKIIPKNCLFYISTADTDYSHLSKLMIMTKIGNHKFATLK